MDPKHAVNRRGPRVGQRGATDRGRFDIDDRMRAVYRAAVSAAPRYASKKVKEATDFELKEIGEGVISGLLTILAIVGLSTLIGAGFGAALGAPAGGVGAIPGAAAGATLGFEVSVAILNFLGFAFLATYIGKGLLDAGRVTAEATAMAWGAIDHPGNEDAVVESAGAHFAYAAALALRGILQGIVAFLLAKGTAAAASRVPELVAQLRASKLGAGFAEWVSKNWQGLLKNPKLARPPEATSGAPKSGSPSVGPPPPAPPPRPVIEPPSRPVAARGGQTPLTREQAANLARFKKSLPKGARQTTVEELPGGSKVFRAEVPGRVPGSKAIYEKTVDASGTTTKYVKTTVDPKGNVVHVKQKFP